MAKWLSSWFAYYLSAVLTVSIREDLELNKKPSLMRVRAPFFPTSGVLCKGEQERESEIYEYTKTLFVYFVFIDTGSFI
jgi:hypothetical protein